MLTCHYRSKKNILPSNKDSETEKNDTMIEFTNTLYTTSNPSQQSSDHSAEAVCRENIVYDEVAAMYETPISCAERPVPSGVYSVITADNIKECSSNTKHKNT